ncbi:MAG: PAS domain-containing sensor histidine kinase [bacterium]
MENKQNDIQEHFFSSKFAEQTLNSINECISITDMQDYIIFANSAFLKTYGFKQEELIGQNISIIRSNKNNTEIAKQILPSTLQGSWEGRIYNKRKDGTEFLISLRTGIVRDDEGNPIALVGSALDLTETIKAEEKLQEAQDRYRSLFNDIKDVVYESTPDGKLVDINQSGIELFGYKNKDEALNIDVAKDLYVFPEDRDRFKALVETKGYVKNYEILIKRKDGEHVVVLETAYAHKGADDKVVSYRGILRDITDVKRTEQQLKNYVRELAKVNKQLLESEEELRSINMAKDKLFSIIAHDLRSPFTALIGFSDYLVEDLEDLEQKEIRMFAGRINDSAKNVYNLLENLLEWSRIESGRINPDFEEFEINAIIESSISLLRGNALNKKIEIINSIEPGLYVIADKNMISSIVRNLISNAIKFTYSEKQIIISSETSDKYVAISVTDEGVGMEGHVLEKLFNSDIHHTTLGTSNEKGSGLGLVICKELVEKNGGRISVRSAPEAGSTFTINLLKAKTLLN